MNLKTLLQSAALLAIGAWLMLVVNQKWPGQAPNEMPATAVKPAAEAPPVVLNAAAQTAAQRGVSTCLKRIDQVTNFLNTNSKSGVFLFTPPKEANRSMTSVSMEIQTAGGLSYATASFAPVGGEGCGALYEAVVYWQNTCQDVAAKGFPGIPPEGVLNEKIRVLNGGPALRVYLMPAGSGCVSIKKEILY